MRSWEEYRHQAPAVLAAKWHLRKIDHGRMIRVYGRPRIVNRGHIQIGHASRLTSTAATLELETGAGGVIVIGEQVFINYGTSIGASQFVHIDDRAIIGTHCLIIDNQFHSVEPARRHERPESKQIYIGRDAWVGARCIVLPGVTIGAESVVAAGSVVTRDVPYRTLVAGVPAKVIRELGVDDDAGPFPPDATGVERSTASGTLRAA